MFNYDFTKTDETYYTPLPYPLVEIKVGPFLRKKGIDFKLIEEEQAPDDWPRCYTLNGRKSFSYVVYVEAKVLPAELTKAAEELMLVDRENI